MKPKVLITRPTPQNILARVGAGCEVDSNQEDRPLTRDEIMTRLDGCAGILCHLTDRIDSSVMERAPSLKVIANVAVGYDNIDVASATRLGIMVTNTPDVLTDTTADFAFALLLATARRLVEADQFVRTGQWKEWRFDLLLGTDVHHSTLGIIGLGRIGSAVARRGRGFGMKILYSMPQRADVEVERELGATYVDQATLLSESDFVSVHAPLKAETRHLIGARELALMKPSAILINTARGPVVDETALVEALQSGRIAGAGLDVFEQEPRVHPELVEFPNVVLAPHIASASRQTRLRMMEVAAENLIAGVCGGVPPNVVNREVAERNSKPA
ncbi:MAG: D-glycerate dehydrogenase [Acidobacteria bacterium]|nr:D-glycerate dehydrogenase [Acidobacteriota bacterium]